MTIIIPKPTPTSRNIVLGDPVEFGMYLDRRVREGRRGQSGREWRAVNVHGLQQHKESEQRVNRLRGIIVGTRTLANGTVEYDDGYSYFVPDQRLRVYLVAYELHRAPVHLLPEDVTFL